MVSLPALGMGVIVALIAALIAVGWVLLFSVGIKPHRIIYAQPSQMKPKHNGHLVESPPGEYHWL